MGENKQHILILVNDPEHEVSNEEGKETLRKLIKHLNFSGKDFALINYSNYPNATFKEIARFFKTRSALIFGVKPHELDLSQDNDSFEAHGASLYFTASLGSMQLDDKKRFAHILKNFKL
ncbi:MAG: hypothetical protein EOO02_17755 [Chitinophagaceae bacterium]|nr:MAG: hypothetical protein EOO02_17755 [Chitinophagaceae bacterium]